MQQRLQFRDRIGSVLTRWVTRLRRRESVGLNHAAMRVVRIHVIWLVKQPEAMPLFAELT